MNTVSRWTSCRAAARNPSMSARYSAMLFVTAPSRSPFASTSCPAGSRSTYADAPGPGFPREPPSQRTTQPSRAVIPEPYGSGPRHSRHRLAGVLGLDPAGVRQRRERVRLAARDQLGRAVGIEVEHVPRERILGFDDSHAREGSLAAEAIRHAARLA